MLFKAEDPGIDGRNLQVYIYAEKPKKRALEVVKTRTLKNMILHKNFII
jgi:hypothetical protein